MSRDHPTHGLRFYAALVCSMNREPATGRELSQRFGINMCYARHVQRQLRHLGVLKIVGRKKESRHPSGPASRIYGVGTEDDSSRRPLRPKPALIAFATLWHALADPSAINDLKEETGIDAQALHKAVRFMRQAGMVRIARWERSGSIFVRLYQIGESRDCPRPKPMPKPLISRLSRQRLAAARRAQHLQFRLPTEERQAA